MWYCEITIRGQKKATLRVCLGSNAQAASSKGQGWLDWASENTNGIVVMYRLIDEYIFSDVSTTSDEQDKMVILFRSENGKRFRVSLPAAKSEVTVPPTAHDRDGVAGVFVGMTRSYGR